MLSIFSNIYITYITDHLVNANSCQVHTNHRRDRQKNNSDRKLCKSRDVLPILHLLPERSSDGKSNLGMTDARSHIEIVIPE